MKSRSKGVTDEEWSDSIQKKCRKSCDGTRITGRHASNVPDKIFKKGDLKEGGKENAFELNSGEEGNVCTMKSGGVGGTGPDTRAPHQGSKTGNRTCGGAK